MKYQVRIRDIMSDMPMSDLVDTYAEVVQILKKVQNEIATFEEELKMTDIETIKALEHCSGDVRICTGCPLLGVELCGRALEKNTFKLVKNLQKEFERLNSLLTAKDVIINDLNTEIKVMRRTANSYKLALENAKTEAIKEFAERLKESLDWRTEPLDDYDVDNLVKEMTEEQQ